jgi:hypothetical protein
VAYFKARGIVTVRLLAFCPATFTVTFIYRCVKLLSLELLSPRFGAVIILLIYASRWVLVE